MKRASESIRRSRGAIIVLVLASLMLVAGLLAVFVQRAGVDLIAAARTSDGAMPRREAYSVLETTLAVLAEFQAVDGALYSPAQGWQRPLDYAGSRLPAGVEATVSFSDETGKLSLPDASPESVERLLEYCGVEPAKVRAATEALFAWSEKARALPDPGAAGNSPGVQLRTFGEMASIPILREQVTDGNGQPNAVWQRIVDAASLHSAGPLNINTARPAALYALGWTRQQVDLVGKRREAQDGGDFVRSVEASVLPLGAGQAGVVLGARIETLRIEIAIRTGGAAFRLDATVALRPAGPAGGVLQYPFEILEFHENPARHPLEP